MLWEDNYFPLMPAEKREIAATYRQADAGKLPFVVEVNGWNVTAQMVSAALKP